MPDIKTNKAVKDIKSVNKSSHLRDMKKTLVKTKENAEKPQSQDCDNPHTYASESMTSNAKEVSSSVAYKAERLGRRSIKKAPKTILNAKTGAIRIKQKISNLTKNTKIKGTVKKVNKTTGKTVAKTVKTSKQTAQATIKTAQATAKVAQKTAQAAKVATKVMVQTAKATVKAVVATIKASISAVRGLVTLIAAGGWIAVVIVLIICMVGLLISSPFGIFFSNEETNNPNAMTMTSAIKQINNDFAAEIERIKADNPHDEVDGVTTPQNWKDVLAVYAVKYSSDPQNPAEVVIIDNEKFEDIKKIFWDMNIISFKLKTKEPVTDVSGTNTTQQTASKTILHIIVKNISSSEIAVQYSFDSEQIKQLNELLKKEYDGMWDALLNIKV